MEDGDRNLLALMQRAVPLVREPFAELAARLGCDEPAVRERIDRLREARVIREISAIFDATALGYEQALVAARVPPDRLDRAGRLVATHPGVSHCYGRDGKVNLWFTLAVSPRSSLGLSGTAGLLAELTGAAESMLLPTLRRYKLRVRFGVEGDETAGQDEAGGDPAVDVPARLPAPDLTDEQLRAVGALQVDLPCRGDPFARVAADYALEPDMLLVHAADFLAAGWMRRYAAVLHHRAAGAKANVLVAWTVDRAATDVAGLRAAQLPAVSHCYLRPTGPDWPYNLYTMIHGRSREDCEMTIEQIAATTALDRRAVLWTAAEYKKRRIRLFAPDEAEWEAAHPPGRRPD